DTILFYFSGHGLIDGEKNNAIAPSDLKVSKDFKKIENTINLDELAKQVDTSIEQGIFLIDACRSPLPKGERISLDKANVSETNLKEKQILKPFSWKKKLTFSTETIREDVENARGVTVLIGTSPDNSSLEDDSIKSGIFTYYMIKGLEGGILDENIEEYVTMSSLRSYIDKKFIAHKQENLQILEENLKKTKKDSENYQILQEKVLETKKSLPQKTYLIAPARGVTGDVMISFGRPNLDNLIERVKYFDDDGILIHAKVHLENGSRKSYMNFFSKQESTGKFYPDDLDGVGKMKFTYDENYFEARQFDKEGRETFTHKLEYDPDKKNWIYAGVVSKSDIGAKFEKVTFDTKGKILKKGYFDWNSENGFISYIGGITYTYDSLGKIKEELNAVKGRDYTVKYFYNSKGLLISKKIYRFDNAKNKDILYEDENNTHEYKYSYDSSGNLILEEYFNLKGKLQDDLNNIAYKKYSYDKSGNKIEEEAFRSTHNPLSKEGVTSTVFKYDSKKRVIEKSFFAEAEVDSNKKKIKQIDDFGVHAYRYTYDEECLRDRSIAIRRRRDFYQEGVDWQANAKTSENCYKSVEMLDRSGSPTPNRLGATKIEFINDGGRELFKRYLNSSGKFLYADIPHQVYYANRFDDKGNHIERDLRLVSGELLENQDGFAGIHFKYDQDRREIERIYIGANGKPVTGIRGVARYVNTYNKNGKLISVEMFDPKGKLVAEDESKVAKEIYKYNEKDQLVLTEYYGVDGKLFSDGGLAREKRDYDPNGNVILIEEYSSANKLITKEKNQYNPKNQITRKEIWNEKELVLNKEYFYDKENRLIEENSGSEKTKYTYLDPTHFKEEKELNGQKVPVFGNAFSVLYELNSSGKIISKTYLDESGKNPINQKRMPSVYRYEYDGDGNLILEECLDFYGNLVDPNSNLEPARKIFRYDANRNKIFETYFREDGWLFNIIRNGLSYSRHTIEYDLECARDFINRNKSKNQSEIEVMLREFSGCEIFRSYHKSNGELLQRYTRDKQNNEYLSMEKVDAKGYISVGGERGIQKDTYIQLFENPEGNSNSKRIRLTLDRFHRPIGISFEAGKR
ncbi:MAG TPA: caspase family protein, partial [Leptospiraceae bacterium]|nr:caspase family protein [Leptospiraceae bacterium]